MTRTHIIYLLCCFAMISCDRKHAASESSLEQRVSDLEKMINSNSPTPSQTELQKEYEHNLAEIRKLGLVDLAQQDFNVRITNATIISWNIGYFVNTNTVWCSVLYKRPGESEALQQEFGYARRQGTNWNLIWGNDAKSQ